MRARELRLFLPILPPVVHPHVELDHDQHQQSPLLDVRSAAEHTLDCFSEKESGERNRKSPYRAAHRFINQKLDRRDARYADDHGAGDAQAVQPLRDEDGGSSIALEHADAFSEVLLHPREAIQQLDALCASEPEPEDVADICARKRHEGDEQNLQMTSLGGEACHHQNRLSLEKGPDENSEVSPLLYQKFRSHAGS